MTLDGGWILVQRKSDFLDNEKAMYILFEAEATFKDFYWIGLDNLHLLTSSGRSAILRINIVDDAFRHFWAQYELFRVGTQVDKYPLTVGGYSGNAGDGLSERNGMKFLTFSIVNSHCLGWWTMSDPSSCIYGNLNSQDIAIWGHCIVKKSEMLIKLRK